MRARSHLAAPACHPVRRPSAWYVQLLCYCLLFRLLGTRQRLILACGLIKQSLAEPAFPRPASAHSAARGRPLTRTSWRSQRHPRGARSQQDPQRPEENASTKKVRKRPDHARFLEPAHQVLFAVAAHGAPCEIIAAVICRPERLYIHYTWLCARMNSHGRSAAEPTWLRRSARIPSSTAQTSATLAGHLASSCAFGSRRSPSTATVPRTRLPQQLISMLDV
jgi:hypothetical protein